MDPDTMSVKAMKDELVAMDDGAEDCIEREDLQARLRKLRLRTAGTIPSTQSPASRRAVGAMIREAISIGVPAYNQGNHSKCATVYTQCCEDILDLPGALEGETRKAVREVLRKLPSLASDDARAWQLRHTLDAVLAGGLDARTSHVASTSHDLGQIKKDLAKSMSSPVASSTATHFEGKNVDSISQSTETGSEGARADKENLGISVEVDDEAWEEELTCSICLEFLWEPVKLDCGHHFCRCCLWRTQQLSPDGHRCPNCRANIVIDARTAKSDDALQARVDAMVPVDERLLRKEASDRELEQLRGLKTHSLPIFLMSPGARPGETVRLNLFEPRYREMMKRIMGPDGNKLFIFAGSLPHSGSKGTLVLVQSATTQTQGNVGIIGVCMCSVKLDQVTVDHQAHGLYYGKTSSLEIEKVLAQGAAAREYLAARESLQGMLGGVSRSERGGSIPASPNRNRQTEAAGPRLRASEGTEANRAPSTRRLDNQAELPVFFSESVRSCTVGQRVTLNLFETRYRMLATVVMSTHRLFIFANYSNTLASMSPTAYTPPPDGSKGVIVRVTSAQFQVHAVHLLKHQRSIASYACYTHTHIIQAFILFGNFCSPTARLGYRGAALKKSFSPPCASTAQLAT